MLSIDIQDNCMNMWKTLVFNMLDWSNNQLTYDLPRHIINYFRWDTNPETAYQARFEQDIINKYLTETVLYIQIGFNIYPWYMDEGDIRNQLISSLIQLRTRINFEIQEQKVDNTPDDIKEAIAISKKAMDYAKDINSKRKEIEKDNINYYKKHWTLVEKSKAYIESIYN